MKKIFGYVTLIMFGFALSNCGGKKEGTPPAYDAITETDYKWRQEVVTIIDVREEANKGFQEGDKPLIDVLLDAALIDSSLNTYHPIFGFEHPLTIEELNQRAGTVLDTQWVPAADPPYLLEPVATKEVFDRTSVVKYYVTENWFYSNDEEVAEKRIVSISAILENLDDDGNLKGHQPLFSFDLTEASELLWNVEGDFNGESTSYLEAFQQGKYSSTMKTGHPRLNNKVALFSNDATGYPDLKTEEIAYVQDFWSVIDLTEVENENFAYPQYNHPSRKSLIVILLNEIRNNESIEVKSIFGEALSREDFEYKVGPRIDSTWVMGDGQMDVIVTEDSWDETTVESYRIRETWYYNSAKEVVDKRIMAICPVATEYDDEGNIKGDKPLFWVDFGPISKALSNEYVYVDPNSEAPVELSTYEEVLLSGKFSSTIIIKDRYKSVMKPFTSEMASVN